VIEDSEKKHEIEGAERRGIDVFGGAPQMLILRTITSRGSFLWKKLTSASALAIRSAEALAASMS